MTAPKESTSAVVEPVSAKVARLQGLLTELESCHAKNCLPAPPQQTRE